MKVAKPTFHIEKEHIAIGVLILGYEFTTGIKNTKRFLERKMQVTLSGDVTLSDAEFIRKILSTVFDTELNIIFEKNIAVITDRS